MYNFRGLYVVFFSCLFVMFCGCAQVFSSPWAIEAKGGLFFPTSKKIRAIFDTTMPFLELETSYRYSLKGDIWVGAGCMFREGYSLGCGDKVTIQVIPITLGTRRFFSLNAQLDAFLGFGGVWSFYHNNDGSSYVKNNITGNTFGGVFKGGFQYRLKSHVFLSVFTEYFYQYFSFNRVYEEHFTYRHDVDMSGIVLGGGISYAF